MHDHASSGSTHVVSSHCSYDQANRLTKLVHNTSTTPPASGWGTDPLAGYVFTYDAVSRIASIDSYADGLTTYAHDDTNQLTSADHTGQTDEGYAYDANGNRTGGGYTVGTNNRTSTDGTYNFVYDDEGNLSSKTKISNGEKEEYTWDHRNRLVTITFKNSGGTVVKTVDQTYDVFNRWIGRSVDPDGATGSVAVQNIYFVYDGNQILFQFDGSSSSDLTQRYLWNPMAVDQLLAAEDVTSLASAGNTLWPLGDHLGTLRDIADHNEGTGVTTVTNHRRYEAFGELVSETNAAVDLLFGFTGRALDESTGLQNNLHRWYMPDQGEWMSEDPIGFRALDANVGRYVGNDPVTNIDPLGLAENATIGAPDDPEAHRRNHEIREFLLHYYRTNKHDFGYASLWSPSSELDIVTAPNEQTEAAIKNIRMTMRIRQAHQIVQAIDSICMLASGAAAYRQARPWPITVPGLTPAQPEYAPASVRRPDTAITALVIYDARFAARQMGIDAEKFVSLPQTRQEYVTSVYSLRYRCQAMREAGTPAERIARELHAERRAIGVRFKGLTPPEMLEKIYARNLQKYGDRLGPTIEWLRARGKTWEDIIESASRVGGTDLGF